MEGQVWVIVEEWVSRVEGVPTRCTYSDGDILRVSLWAILHDRPMSWACRAENGPVELRPRKLRDEVERAFGQAANVAFGFKQLPAWARRSRRVYRWMWGKNLLHNLWLLNKANAA